MNHEPTINITFRHVESSDLIRDHAMGQLEKVLSFLRTEHPPVHIELIFEPSKIHAHHKVELMVSSPHYHKIISYERPGIEFYELIDRTVDIMYKELHEAKRKRVNKTRESHNPRDVDRIGKE